MPDNRLLQVATFLFILFIIGVLSWLTLTETQEDPCANPQADVSAAVLADDAGDQDALANRAIILRGKCEPDDQ